MGIKAKKTEEDNSYIYEELKAEIEKARKDVETGKLKPTTTDELWASID